MSIIKTAFEKGFFHLLSANFIIMFFSFCSQLLVAKFLTAAELGQIKVIQSYLNIANVISGFGFNTAILKLCSEEIPEHEKNFIFKKNFIYSSYSIIITWFFFIFLAYFCYLSPDPVINNLAFFYFFSIPALSYTTLIITYLQSLKKIQLISNLQVIIRFFGILLLIFLTYIYGINGYILSTIIVSYFSFFSLLKFIKNTLFQEHDDNNKYIYQKSFFIAKWSLMANFVSILNNYIDILFLNFFLVDRNLLGYYSISTIFIMALDQITLTVQSICAPYFSEKSKKKKEFLQILQKYQRIMIIFSFIISVFSFFFVPYLINIIYKNKYLFTQNCFKILILKYFFNSCYAIPAIAIWGIGKIHYNFWISFISFIISLILNYVFILNYGIIGAAWAQSIIYFFNFILVNVAIIYLKKTILRINI